jgi:hypothetical protein
MPVWSAAFIVSFASVDGNLPGPIPMLVQVQGADLVDYQSLLHLFRHKF